MSAAGLIYKKIPLIMADINPIAKARKNTGQGYQFRGIDDVYNEIQEHMAKHGVFSAPTVLAERSEERTSKGGSHSIYRILTVEYRFYAEDGSYVTATVIGEGMDSGDKASNKALSAADKYACLQIFKIPTAEKKDSEEETPSVEPKVSVERAKPAARDSRDSSNIRYEGLDSQRRWVAQKTRERFPAASDDDLDEIHTRMLHQPFKAFGPVVQAVMGARDA